MKRHRHGRRGQVTTLVAVIGGTCTVVLALTAGITAASFTDRASLRLNGDDGIGGRFDIAVVGADGSTLEDAVDEASAMTVSFAPTGTPLTKDVPLRFTSTIVNREDSAPGDVTIAVFDPDPAPDDVFAFLRFDVDLDGDPIATAASADEVNALATRIEDIAPGERHEVRVSVSLDGQTPRAYNGRETAVGLTFDGATP
jgi:hypothetical protein